MTLPNAYSRAFDNRLNIERQRRAAIHEMTYTMLWTQN